MFGAEEPAGLVEPESKRTLAVCDSADVGKTRVEVRALDVVRMRDVRHDFVVVGVHKLRLDGDVVGVHAGCAHGVGSVDDRDLECKFLFGRHDVAFSQTRAKLLAGDHHVQRRGCRPYGRCVGKLAHGVAWVRREHTGCVAPSSRSTARQGQHRVDDIRPASILQTFHAHCCLDGVPSVSRAVAKLRGDKRHNRENVRRSRGHTQTTHRPRCSDRRVYALDLHLYATLRKSRQLTTHQTEPSVWRDMAGHTETRDMNPLLAHPRTTIEPHLNDGKRDEGEQRLVHLRAALRALVSSDTDGALSGFLDSACDRSLAAALGACTAEAATSVHAAFMDPAFGWNPVVRLVEPLASFFPSDLADEHLSPENRAKCIPVRGETTPPVVAVPHDANPPPAQIVAQVPRRRLGGGVGVGGSSGSSTAKGTLTLTRLESGEVEVSLRSDKGARSPTVVASLPPDIVRRLFARAPPAPRALALLPKTANELCGKVADAVAQFWHHHLRAHVLPAALAPVGSFRPLAIESVTVHSQGGIKRRTTLRAELAPSCATCICGLHGVLPNPNEHCVSSAVKLELSMCGQPLYMPAPECATCPRWCHTHLERTPQDDRIPFNACGFGLQAAVVCVHKMADGKTRAAVHHTFPLHGVNVLHARMLIASAARTQARSGKLVGKTPEDDLCRVCEEGVEELAVGMDAVHAARAQSPSPYDEEARVAHDAAAANLLQANQGRVWQHRKSDGTPTLARRSEDSGRIAALPAKEAACAVTHGHWFPEPPRSSGRRGRGV